MSKENSPDCYIIDGEDGEIEPQEVIKKTVSKKKKKSPGSQDVLFYIDGDDKNDIPVQAYHEHIPVYDYEKTNNATVLSLIDEIKGLDNKPDVNEKPKAPTRTPSYNRRPSSNNVNQRYHVADTKAEVKPGTISEELRRALGLRAQDLPWYIYRMRRLGYPPGWLRQAQQNSQNSLSCVVNGSEDEEEPQADSCFYDASQFITYPGFNADAPGCDDAWKDLNACRQRESMFMQAFIHDLENRHCNVINKSQWCKEEEKATPSRRRKHSQNDSDRKEKSKRAKCDDAVSPTDLDALEKARQEILNKLANESGSTCDSEEVQEADTSVKYEILSMSMLDGSHCLSHDASQSDLNLDSFSQNIQQVYMEEVTPARGTLLKVRDLLKRKSIDHNESF